MTRFIFAALIFGSTGVLADNLASAPSPLFCSNGRGTLRFERNAFLNQETIPASAPKGYVWWMRHGQELPASTYVLDDSSKIVLRPPGRALKGKSTFAIKVMTPDGADGLRSQWLICTEDSLSAN